MFQYLLSGQSSWAEGIGEILTHYNLPKYFYLVVSINKHISTQEIFSTQSIDNVTSTKENSQTFHWSQIHITTA